MAGSSARDECHQSRSLAYHWSQFLGTEECATAARDRTLPYLGRGWPHGCKEDGLAVAARGDELL